MRHIYAYRITYIIAALLIAAAAFFAWIQSEEIAIVADETDEREVPVDPDRITELADFDWEELGETVYIQECSACHQPDGEGTPDLYPPLAGHAPELFRAEGGREFLIKVVLYGLEGEIVVGGEVYDEPMPPMPQLDDVEIAAVLNRILTAWNNEERLPDDPELYLPADVADERDRNLTPGDVLSARQELDMEAE